MNRFCDPVSRSQPRGTSLIGKMILLVHIVLENFRFMIVASQIHRDTYTVAPMEMSIKHVSRGCKCL